MKGLISVILPVYNGEKYLKEAIQSLLSQTYSHFEIIAYDDGSTDSSLEIIRSFQDKRIRLFKNDENCGLITTLNKALGEARGEFIARMDADDICLPDRFEKQINYFKWNDIDILGTEICFINEEGKTLGRGVGKYPGMEISPYTFLQRCPIYHPTVMFKKKIVKQKDFYDHGFPHAEDYELWMRLSKHHKLDLIDEPLLFYRVHGESITSTYSPQAKKSVIKALERHLGTHLKADFSKIRFSENRTSSDRQTIVKFWLNLKDKVDAVFLAQNIILLYFPRVLPRLFGISPMSYGQALFFFLRSVWRKKLGVI